MNSSSTFQEAKGHEPHDKEDRVEWEGDNERTDRDACKDRVHNTKTGSDHSVDNTAIDVYASKISQVGESAEDTQNNDSTDALSETEECKEHL
jgi:hypothetical protein